MKTKLALLIMVTLSISACVSTQSHDKHLWENVNKNLEDKLPKSASASLDSIEYIAIKTNNQKELLKAFLYRFKIFSLQEENPIEASIKFAEENISRLQEPEKSIFNLAIASLYENYLNDNRYSIRKNVPILSDQQSISIKFWDEASFKRVINQYYENALSNIEVLQNTPIEPYSDILTNEQIKKQNLDIEPTLYDYTAHKIINHYKNNDVYDKALSLYNDLISFDQERNFTNAKIYNEIYKLKLENKNSCDFDTYFNSLEKIKQDIIDNPLVTSVMALQAELLLSKDSEDDNLKKSLAICNEAISLFPNSIGAKQCESIRSNITEKELTFSMQDVVVAKQAIPASISYKNLTKPHYRIYKLSQNEIEELARLSKMETVKALLRKSHIIEDHIDIPEETDYQEHSSLIALPELEYGAYFIMFSKDDIFSSVEAELPAIHSFQVSNLSFVTTKENNNFCIYVVDRETGKAVKDVNVNVYKQKYDYNNRRYIKVNITNLTTDVNGYAKISNVEDESFHIDLSKGDDKFISDSYFYNYQDNQDEKLRERTTFFTDRAIYRPGQTVHFKGIMLNQNSKIKELVVGKTTKVIFRDSNWQEIGTQTFTTNEFGSFDGSFVIPNNLSNGSFCIINESGDIRFKVEEYKRPTFEITFNDIDKTFKLNEELDLSGSVKAYAGFGLDNINYTYTVSRHSYFPYRYWWVENYNDTEKQIAFGEGKTNSKGEFNINFKLLPDENDRDKLAVFEYIVTVNATNTQGETQTKRYSLKASEIDIIINIDNTDKNISCDELKSVTFNVKNLKESAVKTKIIRKIYKLDDNKKFIKDYYNFDRKLLTDEELNKLFPEFDYYADKQQTTDNSKLIYEDAVEVDGTAKLFPNVKNLIAKGRYVVELISADNNIAKTYTEFNVVDFNSNKMPFKELCLSYFETEGDTQDVAHIGDKLNFYLGSSAKDVNVYVVIKHGEEIRYSAHTTINDNILKIPYKVKENDRGCISFQAFFVKYNTINIVQHNITVPYDNLKLDIRLDVERDNLLPGEEEKWNLTVSNYKSEDVVANILAGMYDASLDVFAKNDWSFNTTPNIVVATRPKSDNSYNNFSCSANNQVVMNYELFDYHLLSDATLSPYMRYNRFYASTPIKNSVMISKVEKTATEEDNDEVILEMADPSSNPDYEDENIENQEMSIRENFNETAFFYPNLNTNDDGSLTFSFRMPDALTRWNLMMLAYTKDLKVGTLGKTFTSSKPLMIMSDMPRFCYENDTVCFVANVISQSDNTQQAAAKLEIFNALTMQPLDLILSDSEINIDAISEGESRALRWKVAVGDNYNDANNLLAMRFSVTTDGFSDAEQHLLPILSNEVFMTETYPLTVGDNSEKTFDFNFKYENERNQGLTLNFCANPVWYAIQALPYLSQETGEQVDVAFNIFYANSLSSFIAHNIPNLLNYIKEWQIESPDALMSQLQKDENLKAIILQETPWVMEAKTEAEQKSRITNLFDISSMSNKTDEVLKLLSERQSINGGWSWLPNMPENAAITQYILGGLGRLYNMEVIESLTKQQQQQVKNISDKAVKYLSEEIIRNYNIEKEYKKSRVSHSIINELYALSFFSFDESSKYENAKEFYLEKVEKDWRNFDFAQQAKSALILYREGMTNTAELIMKSLKERAQQKDLSGIYWYDGSSYYNAATIVSEHTFIMEAFQEIAADKDMLNEMMIWLLNHKRTNMWDDARASADAIYAIMKTTDKHQLNSSCLLSGNNIIVSEDAGKQQTVLTQKYWNADEMADFNSLKVENKTDNLVWGGLFRQYFVSIDEVRKHKSPLNIDKEMFVEKTDNSGTYLVPVKDTEINVGDKIVVNLTFEASQDMEFVFLKDLRAACLEPTEQMSRYKHSDGMYYYQSNSDTFMGFYFDNVTKGLHRVSYSMYVTKEGDFSNGYALIQCMYAPEFSAYSEGMRIIVE